MRLFIAINFTPEIKETLSKAMSELKKQAISANLTRQENLHMTLAFIGESERVDDIAAVIDEVFEAPVDMTLALGGVGRFGNLYYANINSTDEAEIRNKKERSKLALYAEVLADRLRMEGFDIEDREFRPHVTLAREVNSYGAIKFSIPKKTMAVHRISLMRSDRVSLPGGKSRMKYTEVWGKDI